MIRIFALLCALCALSCSMESVPEAVKPQVVVIFANAPLVTRYYAGADTVNGPNLRSSVVGASYIDSSYIKVQFTPNPNAVDTLIIPTFDGLAEMWYGYNVVEKLNFLFMAGDTVRFTFDSRKYPIAECVNNPKHTDIYNVRLKDRMGNGFSPKAILTSIPMRWAIRKPKDMSDYSRLCYPFDTLMDAYKAQKIAYNNFLDTLPRLDSGYAVRARFIEQVNEIGFDSAMASLTGAVIAVESDPTKALYNLIDDKLAHSLTYQSAVLSALTSQIAKRYSPLIKYTNYGGGGGGSFYDMRQAFDSIMASTRIAPISKHIMLRNIAANYEFVDIDSEIAYKRKFFDFTGDTIFINEVAQLERSLSTSADLQLQGVNGTTIGFEELIKTLKGKVVYVDFWGSGCPPCIRAMPAAAALRQQFKGSNVAFVCISYDDDNKAWLDAIKTYSIDPINYRMTNLRVADFTKKYHLYEFPRYMIYNKNGVLVEQRAASPEKTAAAEAIKSYL